MFKLSALILVLTMWVEQSEATPHTARYVSLAKDTDVGKLDPSLPSQRLEAWLRMATGIDDIKWTTIRCCNCDDPDDRVCVRFDLGGESAVGWGVLDLDERANVPSRSPHIVELISSPFPHLQALSELPGLLSRRKRILEYAQSLDVSRLDAALPATSLDGWLRKGPARFETIVWSLSDCDLPGEPESPLCAKFVFRRAQVSGYGSIAVGTIQDGIVGPPRLVSVLVVAEGGGGAAPGAVVDRLSDLPGVVASFMSHKRGIRPRGSSGQRFDHGPPARAANNDDPPDGGREFPSGLRQWNARFVR